MGRGEPGRKRQVATSDRANARGTATVTATFTRVTEEIKLCRTGTYQFHELNS